MESSTTRACRAIQFSSGEGEFKLAEGGPRAKEYYERPRYRSNVTGMRNFTRGAPEGNNGAGPNLLNLLSFLQWPCPGTRWARRSHDIRGTRRIRHRAGAKQSAPADGCKGRRHLGWRLAESGVGSFGGRLPACAMLAFVERCS